MPRIIQLDDLQKEVSDKTVSHSCYFHLFVILACIFVIYSTYTRFDVLLYEMIAYI